MAKIYVGAYGTFKNSFMNAVQYKWRGLIVGREYNGTPNNPNTIKQQTVRAKFRMLANMAGALSQVLEITMHRFGVQAKTTPQGQFISQNFGAFTGGLQTNNLAINYEEIKLTAPDAKLTGVGLGEASFSTPKRVVVPIENGYINSEVNSANDRVFLVVVNTVKNLAMVSDGSATRSDSEVKLDVTGDWAGDYVEVYVFVMAAVNTPHDPNAVSATIYGGTGTIA